MATRKIQTYVDGAAFAVIEAEAVRQKRSIRAVCSDVLHDFAVLIGASGDANHVKGQTRPTHQRSARARRHRRGGSV